MWKRPTSAHHTVAAIETPATSAGYKALVEAFTAVIGRCEPYSITGSLPCIRDLQEAGFDVQTLGFGACQGSTISITSCVLSGGLYDNVLQICAFVLHCISSARAYFNQQRPCNLCAA
jgi:hypothetical protein